MAKIHRKNGFLKPYISGSHLNCLTEKKGCHGQRIYFPSQKKSGSFEIGQENI